MFGFINEIPPIVVWTILGLLIAGSSIGLVLVILKGKEPHPQKHPCQHVQQEVPTIFCTQCGTKNRRAAQFCHACGLPINKSAPEYNYKNGGYL